MGFDLSSLIGGSIGDAFAKIVGVFKVSPAQALEAQTEITKIQLELQSKIVDQVQGQLDINKVEAASTNWWVAGWRPYIGWICGSVLLSQYILGPFFEWGAALLGHPTPWPKLDGSESNTILMGMLGLAGMRTAEKFKDVAGAKGLH